MAFLLWLVRDWSRSAAIALAGGFARPSGSSPMPVLVIALWLWFTVLFANFAEAIAEARGKAQAASLRKSKRGVSTYLAPGPLYSMRLEPRTPILSSVIFNALFIVVLIPLALRSVKYRPVEASRLLGHNMIVCGVGGHIVPFIGVKLIDGFVNLG